MAKFRIFKNESLGNSKTIRETKCESFNQRHFQKAWPIFYNNS